MHKDYRRFAATVFVVGALVAVAGPTLLDLIALQTWDVILPPPTPKLIDPEMVRIRVLIVHYLSYFPVFLGVGLALFAASHWFRARRLAGDH